MTRTYFITGTDTGVGKTVLTALLTQFLHAHGVKAAALKPICSGGRDDARALHAAMNGALTLNEVNPWHFRAAVAPSLAARRENKIVTLKQVVASIRATQRKFDVVLVEGAGGLLSPLGEQFDSRDLIVALRAVPLIVAPNQLGMVNHLLLTLEALPRHRRVQAKVVLMSPPKPDTATAANFKLLSQFLSPEKIFSLPWLGHRIAADLIFKKTIVRQTLQSLMGG